MKKKIRITDSLWWESTGHRKGSVKQDFISVVLAWKTVEQTVKLQVISDVVML